MSYESWYQTELDRISQVLSLPDPTLIDLLLRLAFLAGQQDGLSQARDVVESMKA